MKRIAILVIASMSCVSAPSALAFDGVGHSDKSGGQGGVEPPSSISMATYNGRVIDLREGWGTASACHVGAAGTTTCFDTDAEMDAFIDAKGPPNGAALRSSARVNCASTVRLYDAISYGVLVLALDQRMVTHNLAVLGFDNATTSYKIGACSAVFWDGVGAGTVYPGNTSASAQSPNMVTGWNNRISSVYIY